MKKQWKGFVAGFIAAILVLSLAVPVLAATTTKQLTAHYNDIKISLNGIEVVPQDAAGNTVEPFIVDGTTYLPIRAIATALGLDVAWDGTNKTAILTSPDPAVEPSPEPTPEPTLGKNTRLYVLMYHHFVPDGTECNPWTLTVSRFREDLQWLSDNGYTTVLPSELAAGMELPEKAVMITFDDGYASNYDLAFPLLKEFNAKAVISLITSKLERTLTWDECLEMAQSGLVEFGSHTHAVHSTFSSGVQRLPGESQADYEARIFSDIMASVELIERNLGTKVHMFAYPYGKTDEWAEQFMKDTFTVTVNSVSTTASIKNGLYDLPRYNITMNTPLSMYLE